MFFCGLCVVWNIWSTVLWLYILPETVRNNVTFLEDQEELHVIGYTTSGYIIQTFPFARLIQGLDAFIIVKLF